jgi:hypothetical protein
MDTLIRALRCRSGRDLPRGDGLLELSVVLFGLVGVDLGELLQRLGECVVGAEVGVDGDGIAAAGVARAR